MFPISRLLLPLFHPSLGLELHRTLSSQAPVLQNAVKHRLRALYKLVHPDLFHDDPTAKVSAPRHPERSRHVPNVRTICQGGLKYSLPSVQGENERSFKLLQEYLAAAEERAGSGGAAIVPYRFVFYVKQPSIEGQDIEPNRVSLTLPPPVSSWIS